MEQFTTEQPATPGAVPASRNPVGRWLTDRSLRTKIFIIIGVLAVVAIFAAAYASTRMSAISDKAQLIYSEGVVAVDQIDQVAMDMTTIRREILNHIVSTDAAQQTDYEKKIAALDEELAGDLPPTRPTRCVRTWSTS